MSNPSLQVLPGTLTSGQAAHLLRRATFGPTKTMIDQFTGKTAAQAINDLFTFSSSASPPVDPKSTLMFTLPLVAQPNALLNSQDFQLKEFCILWWLDLMLKDGPSIREKLVFFWHKHIPTIQSRIGNGQAIWYQVALFRHFAKGNFRELAKAIVYDNAMLVHLDGYLNAAGNPQENFAREFMELFTIGKGPQDGPNSYTNYTDADVVAGAKVLSGWNIDHSGQSRHAFNNNIACGKPRTLNILNNNVPTHDNTIKIFSAKFNNYQIAPANPNQVSNANDVKNEKDAFVTMVFSQVATARYLVRSLYRFFVYYEIPPNIETNIIEPLAQTLFSNGYNIEPVLKTLLSSQHFYDQDPGNYNGVDIAGSLIKSPLDLVVGTYRLFEVHPSPYPALPLTQSLNTFYNRLRSAVFNQLPPMGMELYEPIEVAGYQAYYQPPVYNRNWITPSFLANRYKFAGDFLNVMYYGNMPMYNINLSEFVKNRMQPAEAADPNLLVAKLTGLFFPSTLPAGRLADFSGIILGGMSQTDWLGYWQYYSTSGDNSFTEPVLTTIFKKMMQSPEYQLM